MISWFCHASVKAFLAHMLLLFCLRRLLSSYTHGFDLCKGTTLSAHNPNALHLFVSIS